MSLFKHFVEDDRGATAIEYALIAGIVSIAMAGTIPLISGELETIFRAVADAFIAALA